MQSRRGFPAVVAAQFFSSLADNALLIAAIGLLMERQAAAWMTPALRLFFYLSYVLLAPFAGAVADALPKGRVMFVTNLAKLAGCLLLLCQVHPLLAYALIGCGAAAYSPAKYGILPELLPAARLVAGNAWIEISTVASILLGVVLGSVLLEAGPHVPRWIEGNAANAAALLATLYGLAALCTAAIPAGVASNPQALARPSVLIRDFCNGVVVLWRDPQAQISLAVTSLFWAVSAALQFIVLRWAMEALDLSLPQSGLLQGGVALGMVVGAVLAAQTVPLHQALRVLPLGAVIGAIVLLMPLVHTVWLAALLLALVGLLSGLFVVPMNALLQERGMALMHTGQSVSIQNFNENLASLVLLGVYGALLVLDVSLTPIIVALGALVSVAMLLIVRRRRSMALP
ncbi:MAG: lysophospholipid transporter LplT [Herminiimonas sp.]|nr:lysophospholipid transporter LplT [Herminiimonas sp.]